MPIPKLLRKMELLRAGVTMRQIANACGVDESYVSHIVSGRKAHTGDKAWCVMEMVARALGSTVHDVFGVDRRDADRRAGERRSA